jgi:hypothetical protein
MVGPGAQSAHRQDAAPAITRAFGLIATLLLSLGCSESAAERRYPPAEDLYDSQRCAGCHPSHYDEWSASMHAYAARDPVFIAMNERGQQETDGALGSLCVNCHAPMAVLTGATVDGLNLDEVPDSLKGVTCYFCHNVEAVDSDHNNPLRLSQKPVMRGRIRDPVDNDFHQSAYSSLLDGAKPESATLCGACHDIVVPSPPAPVPVALERTFVEWKESVFSPENSPTPSAFSTCNSCHLPVSANDDPIGPNGPRRDRHSHHMAAVDAPLDPFPSTDDPEKDAALAEAQALERARVLDPTLRIEICVQELAASMSAIHLTLDNASAGHHFPSGAAQDRRAFVEVLAYQADELIYQSGVVEDGEDPLALGDPDLWMFRDETFDADGNETHMFWNVAEVVSHTVKAQVTADPSDRRYYESHAVRRFPFDPEAVIMGIPDRVTVRVRITPVGLDVLDDLIGSGHLDAGVRDAMKTADLIPYRRLAVADDSPLASLRTVSMEYSAATKASALFQVRDDFTVTPPLSCVGVPRR